MSLGSSQPPQLTVPLYAKKPPGQLFDAFLVLDVEGTCDYQTGFGYPNEIIEFPVCLLRWISNPNSSSANSSQLSVVRVFHSFVQPTWKPALSDFCSTLTGITQDVVDAAPTFPIVLASFREFMVETGLIDGNTGSPLIPFCWCTDTTNDIQNFVVKQCFISNIPIPPWFSRNVMDIRRVVWHYASQRRRVDSYALLNISSQLRTLGLPSFQGREHSGLDDARNVSSILIELSRKGVRLKPNIKIDPKRRWSWMGKAGQVVLDG